jgi:hypothetical protein|tara:strand:+ start:340 stop:519 length:180 start_codon:yes stop_codon:yes gene_type:complete
MRIQVGDIVKILGNQFLHMVLDVSECELKEFNQALVQRVGDFRDEWVHLDDCEAVENTQ